MGLSVYYVEDVARVLGALDVASGGSAQVVSEVLTQAADARRLADYRRGYQDALAGVALAFGIAPRGWAMLGEGDT